MKKTSQKPLILSAYARGEHLDLYTVLEEKRELKATRWERMGPAVTSTRRQLSNQIGADTGKFQTVILCVESSRCLLQPLSLPTTDPKEIEAMAGISKNLFPVLAQPDFIAAHALISQDAHLSQVLSVIFRKDEIVPLLEKVEKWGADLPLVAPDCWVVWRSAEAEFKMPERYAWIWIDPAPDEAKIFLKIFFVERGQVRFVFQPFVPQLPEGHLGGPVMEVLRAAIACAEREQNGLAAEAPFYFSSYKMHLNVLLQGVAMGNHPMGQIPVKHPPQEMAAQLFQQDRGKFRNWLPLSWKTYQAERARSRRWVQMAKTAGVVYAILLALFMIFLAWQHQAVSGQEKLLASQSAEYERAVALKKQVSRMRAQAEGNQGALDVLYMTTIAMPREVTLTGYSFKYQNGLSLRGFAPSNAAVYDYVEALKKQKPFRAVELNGTHVNPQKNWVEFDIQCILGAPEPVRAPKLATSAADDGGRS